jgi:hypothetical protein
MEKKEISNLQMLARIRELTGSKRTGSATKEEQALIDETMRKLGYEKVFHPQPLDYKARAAELGMSEDDLRELLRKVTSDQ